MCRALLLSIEKVCTFIDEQCDALGNNVIKGAKCQSVEVQFSFGLGVHLVSMVNMVTTRIWLQVLMWSLNLCAT